MVELVLRPGHVDGDFIALVRRPSRTPAEEARLVEMKEDMATRLMALSADQVYDAR